MDGYPDYIDAPDGFTFGFGERLRKTKGSRWQGRVVDFYLSSLTDEGYAIESETEVGSVQIYPLAALERVPHPTPEQNGDK